jgi:tetratricopeptide (TPR) repeat protein
MKPRLQKLFRGSKKKKTNAGRLSPTGNSQAVDAGGAQTAKPAAPAPRRWFFRLMAAVFIPALFLGLLELALRLGGYGESSHFFLRSRVNGRDVYVENRRFCDRFFPPALVRHPQPCIIDARKASGVKRIFVFGESAAMGDPEPSFGMARVMESLLRERYPGVKFEVANVSITAINSHVLLPMARDIARLEGDLWILYMGNNEVVGPFGAGTVFSRKTPPLAFIRLNAALKATRTGQLAAAVARGFARDSSVPKVWGGMEMFLNQRVRRDDPRMARVYAHFDRNLRDMIQLGNAGGAKIIVSTLAANLSDCAPFASLHRANLGAAELAAWEKEYSQGAALQQTNDHAGALACYDRAAKLDSEYAEVFYRAGQCHLALGCGIEAKKAFEEALERDVLRFRPDHRINETVRQAGTGREAEGIYLADAAAALGLQAPHQLPGDDFLYEHVHPTFEGNYWIGRALAEKAAQALSDLKPSGNDWISLESCACCLALTDWDKFNNAETMIKRMQEPPFIDQSDRQIRDSRWKERLAALKPGTNPIAVKGTLAWQRQELERWPTDWQLRAHYARMLQQAGEDSAALDQWQETLKCIPHYAQGNYAMAVLLDRLGKTAEAQFYFREAIRLRPEFPEALIELGSSLSRQGKYPESIAAYRQAVVVKPEFAEGHVNLGLAYAKAGKPAEAIAAYNAALKIKPNTPSAYLNLGNLLLKQGRPAEAVAQYSKALALDPDNAIGRFNLGNSYLALGQQPEAFVQYGAAVKLKPNFTEARLNWGLALAKQGKNAEAMLQFQEAAAGNPNCADAHFNLAVCHAQTHQWRSAVEHFKEALRLEPGNIQAQRSLAAAQSMLDKVK